MSSSPTTGWRASSPHDVASLPRPWPWGRCGRFHGDFYLGNLVVEVGRVSGLIDLEFARVGPADLELTSVIGAVVAEHRTGVSRPPLVEWLRDDHPQLFESPELSGRQWLYVISYSLRQSLFWPADRTESGGPDASHPLHTRRRLVQAPP